MRPGTPGQRPIGIDEDTHAGVAARAERAKLTPRPDYCDMPMGLATFGPSLTADFTAALTKCRRYDLHDSHAGPMAGLSASTERHTINCADDILPADEDLFLVASPDRGLFQADSRRSGLGDPWPPCGRSDGLLRSTR